MTETLTFDQLPSAVSLLGKRLESIEQLLTQNSESKQQTELQDQLFTTEETAEFLGLSVPTIYTLVRRKQLPFMKRSKRLYFSRIELTDYLKERRNKTHAETGQKTAAFSVESEHPKNTINKTKNNTKRGADRNRDKMSNVWDSFVTILQKYYCKNLAQLNGIYWLCIIVMIMGLLLIVSIIVASLFSELKMKHETIGIVAGIVTEFIGATFLFIYRSTIKQAMEYSKSLEEINKVGMSIKIVESIKTDDSLESKINETKLEIAKMLLAGNKNNA